MKIGAAAMLSAVVAWVVKPDASPAPPVIQAKADVEPGFSPAFESDGVKPVTTFAHESRSMRNPFSYVEPPPPPPKPVVIARVEPPVVVVQPEPATPRVEPLPPFPYRFIGRFGPDGDPLAAFTRDGDVLTVRRGATIDGQFVVQRIGIESVEIGYVNRDATLKLSLEGSV